VGSVQITGAAQEAIFIEIARDRVARLGQNADALIAALRGQGVVSNAGDLANGDWRLRLQPTGGLDSLDAIANQWIISPDGGATRLGDIATITRGYLEPPNLLLRYNGYPAVAVGVSTMAGGNVVTMGEGVKRRLNELLEQTPVGIELGVVSMQSDSVQVAINDFVVGLVESVAIVVGVLLLAMGLRSGLLIGGILLLTIAGTFIVMKMMAVDLQRISLGALIIALGMLVDNAIVVVEGMLSTKPGQTRQQAAVAIVGQTTWPLLGATLIAVLAFAPIGLSPDNTGDYCGSLYSVIWVSLLLSWVFAITSTPVLGCMVLGQAQASAGDPYAGRFFAAFRGFLQLLLRWRWLSVAVLAALLVTAVIGMGKVRQGFFPASARAQFLIEIWKPQGTDIRAVERRVAQFEHWLRQRPGVTALATCIGAGAPRFELTYSAEQPNSAYAQVIVSVQSQDQIDALMAQVRQWFDEQGHDEQAWPWRMMLGPGGKARIQARLRGPDRAELRRLAASVQQVMADDPYTTALRSDWRNPAPVLQPVLQEPQASRLGLTRQNVSDALQAVYRGRPVGLFREGDEAIPLMLRAPEHERRSADQIGQSLIYSPRATQAISAAQVIARTDLAWEDSIIVRRNRQATLTVQCDPAAGTADDLFNRLRPKIEALPLPVGYSLEWGGEYESVTRANAGLSALMPVCFGLMVLILIGLFNNLRQPLIILLTVPLAIIGVAVGLLTTGSEFGFMPLLGVLSLSGMLIKNAIVLIDEANAQTAGGVDHYSAIIQSAVSRARPVAMAALTTVLGMIPLLTDVFFKDMAVVIMFGLAFASVLTLLVVPLLYAILYRAHPPQTGPGKQGVSASV
jgi:multidrug efflux pump subunit AcrB